MRRLVVVGLLVAGCDDAVVLEVHPAPGVATDTVQLYIGLGACDDCPGIQPPAYPEILAGDVLFREGANQNVREAKVEGGVARFRIEPSEGLDRFDLAVAVDANGRSAAVIQNLPLDTAGRYRVDLLPAGAKLGAKTAADGNFVALWKQPSGPLPCMGFERWEGGRLSGRIFIVPENDLDCDARTADECAPYGFDALGVPALEESTCTTPQAISQDVTICKLGGPACDELTGTDHACSPGEYCLPSKYCDGLNTACAITTGAADLSRCLFNTDVSPSAILECSVPFKPATDNMHADVCQSTLDFELFPQMPATSPIACAGPDGALLLTKGGTVGPLAFTDKTRYVSKDATGKSWFLDVELRHAYDCHYKLGVSGEKSLAAMGPDLNAAFAQLWITKSGGPARKLLVPLQITYTENCAAGAQCVLRLDAADSLARCLR